MSTDVRFQHCSSHVSRPTVGDMELARTLSAAAAAAAKSLQLCPTLCDPIDGSPPDSPVPGILQARTLEVGCHFLLQRMKMKRESEVAQSCLTLSDPMDCSPPGSSTHGTLQARVLEWVAIAFSTKSIMSIPNFMCTYPQTATKARPISATRALAVFLDVSQVLNLKTYL